MVALEAVLAARETLPTSNEHKASAVRVDELRLKYNTVKKEKLQKEQELHALHAELEDLRAQAETHQAQVEEVQRTRDALAASLQFLEERPVEMDVYLNVGTRGRPTEASLTMAATRDGSERCGRRTAPPSTSLRQNDQLDWPSRCAQIPGRVEAGPCRR